MTRSIITLPRHPLLRGGPLTLERIACYPIITLDASSAGGHKVHRAFAAAGLNPTLAMSATDADVIKAYVEAGLGVAILPAIAFLPERDHRLRVRDARHLFEPTVACIHLRRNEYLPQFMTNFIKLLAPQWDEAVLRGALAHGHIPQQRLLELPA